MNVIDTQSEMAFLARVKALVNDGLTTAAFAPLSLMAPGPIKEEARQYIIAAL